ncbi:helix-turn-helix domain-containing protein [Conexibacter sp. W3-3-2]|uniref:helix-turn-helix domain-containing protein n=1 Tax=Conexibacter sp. W3-3-2 TaxID=2675227 RepID=UPI0018A89A88|nr:helix-turn-helix domain-containing protein [Conexibacter sp. W3-3-2]
MHDSAPDTLTQLDLFVDEAGEYLTIAEAARRVRCCERTIRRAVDSGALRAGRVRATRFSRGAIRIRPDDLDDWLFSDLEEVHDASA